MDPVLNSTDQAPTLGTGVGWILHFVGQLAFQWLPATVLTLGNTNNPPQGVDLLQTTYGPTTVPEATNYIAAASDPRMYGPLVHDWTVFTAVSLFVSLLLAALVVYCVIRILQIRRHENERWEAAQQPEVPREVSPLQLRWRRIVEEVGSETEQNWRLAILESDIMLSELLDYLGYKGETMADKMRLVDRANFNTIDLAWEAHRARNAVAHKGLAEPLSGREARRIIGLNSNKSKTLHKGALCFWLVAGEGIAPPTSRL
jgi:hypothetical protein